MNVKDLRIRDPFVIPENGKYYLTGTDFAKRTIHLYESADLENFSDPIPIFTVPDDCGIDPDADLWAPEIHRANGGYALLFSPLGKNGKRGTWIAFSKTLTGSYRLLGNGPATPKEQFCIDGTLYDEDGTPYLIYSHDWPDCPVAGLERVYAGQICAVRLKDDLSGSMGEPFCLFGGADPAFAVPNPVKPGGILRDGGVRYGTDGPFAYRTKDGRLVILWSPMVGNTYVIAAAVSESGKIRGPYTHPDRLVFSENGGHTMIFCAGDGALRLCFHAPEVWSKERLALRVLTEKDGIPVVL